MTLCVSGSLLLSGYWSALCGIIWCVVIGFLFDGKCNRFTIVVSDLCYMVFLLSYFPQMFVRGPLAHRYPEVNQYVFSVLSFIFGLGIPLLLGLSIKKYKTKSKVIEKASLLIGA